MFEMFEPEPPSAGDKNERRKDYYTPISGRWNMLRLAPKLDHEETSETLSHENEPNEKGHRFAFHG
jgi:hypothetical protein